MVTHLSPWAFYLISFSSISDKGSLIYHKITTTIFIINNIFVNVTVNFINQILSFFFQFTLLTLYSYFPMYNTN